MKIMLTGATMGSNYGDYLFAQIFQDRVSKIIGIENVYWYRSKFTMSNFYSSYLDNFKKCKIDSIDGLVYISGGYFCGNDKKIRDYLRRYYTYFKIGESFVKKNIPYAIIGVDVIIPKNNFLKKRQAMILQNAELLVVRNKQSLECVQQLGIKNAICTADTVFAMEESTYINAPLDEKVSSYQGKLLLLHIRPFMKQNIDYLKKIGPIVNSFLENHKEYAVVLTCDQYNANNLDTLREASRFLSTDKIYLYEYDNPLSLCKLIQKVDFIITNKLHVGLTGAKFSKSVISFSDHTEKIKRLYEQLDCAERTISLSELSYQCGCDMLEKYHNTPIQVPEEIIELANKNLSLLDDFLKNL